MQKIEKWRLQHLSRVLDRMAKLLARGGNCEWGNVFKHFQQEAQQMTSSAKLDVEELSRFIANVKNCYSGLSSFKSLVLTHDDPAEKRRLNRDFYEERSLLHEILGEIESRFIEYMH